MQLIQVLEKVLQEIEEIQHKNNENYMLVQECEAGKSNISRKIDCAANNGFQRCAEKIKEIIRTHMEDEPVSNPDKLDDGWIPVEERLPEPGIYLVSCDDKEYPVKRMRMKGICFYDHNGIYGGQVYAWMPLPASYQSQNCGSKDCPYNKETACPAREGYLGYEEEKR